MMPFRSNPWTPCACAIPLVLLTACSGGSGGPAPVTPEPTGYVVSQTRVDSRTVDYRLSRTHDEPVTGLSFELVFPPTAAGITVVDRSAHALLDGGSIAVGVDDADAQRVIVAGGRIGNGTVSGVGDLLTVRLHFAADVPSDVLPVLENSRLFQVATAGEFSVEVTNTQPWTVVRVP